jgi:hypothetical protein
MHNQSKGCNRRTGCFVARLQAVTIALCFLLTGWQTFAADPGLFTVTVQVLGAGTVTRTPDHDSYPDGAEVTLLAVPNRWYAFSHWGDGDTANPRRIVVSSNQTYVAFFTNTVALEKTFFKVKQWERALGGTDDDSAVALVSAPGGGILIGGHSRSAVGGRKSAPQYGDFDFWVLDLDKNGTTRWEQSFGGSALEFLTSLRQTRDGGYLLVGESDSGASGNKTTGSNGDRDFWVVKIDSTAGKQWEASLGGDRSEQFPVAQLNSDDSLVVGGYSDSGTSGNKTTPGFGGYDFWVVKLGSDGTLQWDQSLGGDSDDFLSVIRESGDGGYVLGGSSYSDISGSKTAPAYGFFDFWVARLDAAGNRLGDQSYGGTGDDILVDIQSAADGGVVVAGYSNSGVSGNKTAAGYGGYDYWIVKLDSAGNKQWDHAFGGTGQDVLTRLQATSDGGFLLCGYSESGADGNKTAPGFGRADFWILKLDANGDKQWEQSFGGSGDDVLFSVRQTSDGGYIFGGYSDSPLDGNRTTEGHGLADFWVIKTDANGQREWEQTLGGNRDDVLYSIQEMDPGEFIFSGYSESRVSGNKTARGYGGRDYWIIKMGSFEVPVGTPLVHVNGQFIPAGSVTVGNSAQVRLQTSFPNGRVCYTLNGAIPDLDSIPYSSPFVVTNSVIVRAVAYSSDFSQSAPGDAVEIVVVPAYTLTVTTAGGGTITLDPPRGPYLSNSVVELKALPAPNWTLLNWVGQASGTNPTITVTMNGAKSVEAIFGTRVTHATFGNGAIVVNPATSLYAYGSSVELTALPDPGYYFLDWENADGVIGTANPLGLRVTTSDNFIGARFATLGPGQSALVTRVLGTGLVDVNPQANVYTNGQTVTLTAQGTGGQVFVGWSGDASGAANPLTVQLQGSVAITAHFGEPGLVAGTAIQTSEGFRFVLLGEVGARYQVDWCTDLQVWAGLTTVTNTAPFVEIVDRESKSFPRRFYRFKRLN